ncbi:zinc finger protein 91-like isoform X2 [Trichoplusia ni]|nr:zinc finger protein 91-like isoform X2 [Trichoplusia ni]XP_026727376.1 zinc finger protein 91-like isoform X2 [Trichoplusia ni]XP_026727377.1 zinc finger protein 91-like isoform X2 [Trichoplusia ni]XP_026727378.1 zinc finger protein 91-like isoform X2 [Trichoplusia ni]XP_026727379.1 zinc finger protein 91-like isoform X2 [Trichoplusia ni]XP_026727380.1 zinc finger protein 91-like isoform X2 [Trichoplusia ni]XP_026727381.1 zinc finger protein 91-like isoform X2 [Trichoplusia ni]XP_02672738
MSDEIDIEEHDLMDNPTIKQIFPDLSVIKQELNEYFFEDIVQDVKLEQATAVTECLSSSKLSYKCEEIEKCNEEIIDNKSNIIKDTEPLKDSKKLHRNVIILGSKPNKDCEANKRKHQKAEPQLKLERVDSFLKQSRRYCHRCFILFPKVNIYSLHNINTHNKRRKVYKLHAKHKCTKCNEILSSRSNLMRHKRNVHNNIQNNHTSKPKTTTTEAEIQSNKGNQCFHCQKLFPTPNSLIEHLYEVLAPKNTETPKGSLEDKEEHANLCNIELTSKINKLVSNSVEKDIDNQLKKNKTVTHQPLTDGIKHENEKSKLSVKCDKCMESFFSRNELRYHKMKNHKKTKKKIAIKIKRVQKTNSNSTNKSGNLLYSCQFCSKYNFSMKFYSLHILSDHKAQVEPRTAKMVRFKPQCIYCPSKMSNMKSYNTHLCKYHINKVKRRINTSDNQENSERKSGLRSVLFQCLECNTYFLSALEAMSHSMHSQSLNDWQCEDCDNKFKNEDMAVHKEQHAHYNTFIEYSLPKTALKLVLYKCFNCTVHYSEHTFLPHKGNCDSNTPNSMYCHYCDILVNKGDMGFHTRQHEDSNVKSSAFSIIETELLDTEGLRLSTERNNINKDLHMKICNTQKCEICSIGFADNANSLHNMDFHKKSIENNTVETTDPKFTDIDKNYLNYLYKCKSCQISVTTYDDVINHCQDHYDFTQTHLTINKCEQCGLVYIGKDSCCPTNYNVNGKRVKVNIKNFTVIEFDPFYMRFDNVFWTRHIFAYISDEQIVKILDNSMYRYECRLKMEELQPGFSHSALYKCDKCQFIIEPQSLYTHAENSKSSSCVNLGKYPCAHCGLCFSSWKHKAAHVKEHEEHDANALDPKPLRLILFNKTEHEIFNQTMFDAFNKYILYQCRKCERVVDKFQRSAHECDYSKLKKCMNCGLLFHSLDYNLHFIRHEELEKFNVDCIFVVMFGQANDFDCKKKNRSTFNKAKLDLTLYKCNKCDLCLQSRNSLLQHTCVIDESRCKCSKCGLYFLENDILRHCKLHDTYYDEFNTNIITYDVSSIINARTKSNAKSKEIITAEKDDPQRHVENDFADKNDFKLKNIIKTKASIKNMIDVKESKGNCKIYKCVCGFHFLDIVNARNHVKMCNVRMKISKQSCFKCNLLFTPGELFNHLLVHHSDKNLQYEYDIVTVYDS